jgi:short-subunit dehydrogenase
MARRVLMLGANSAIARETAKLLARDGDRLFLVARDPNRLEIVARDLEIRSLQPVGRLVADLNEFEAHARILDEASRSMEGLDTVILAHGVLGDQQACQASYDEAEHVLRTNLLGPVSLLTLVANAFEEQGSGTIVGISSVAGDRGRQSNYVYGTSKGALNLFLAGLRNRLHARGVHVLTIKPGFVNTPMTAHLEQGLLFAEPARIARGIRRAMRRGRDVVYLPSFWRVIMGLIRLTPEVVFKRLKL